MNQNEKETDEKNSRRKKRHKWRRRNKGTEKG